MNGKDGDREIARSLVRGPDAHSFSALGLDGVIVEGARINLVPRHGLSAAIAKVRFMYLGAKPHRKVYSSQGFYRRVDEARLKLD